MSLAGGPALVDTEVGHGEDPAVVFRRAGFSVRRLLSAKGQLPDIVVTAQVERRRDWAVLLPPLLRRRAGEPGDPVTQAAPVARQRLAAYVIALSSRGLLATQFSDTTAVPGLWGLPGGGIKEGETAAAAAIREAAEETSQSIELHRILDLQSDHWIGPSPAGEVEDFHALRLIYVAEVPEPADPVVRDIGGTTADARWVPVNRWRQVHWSQGFRTLLTRHLDLIVKARSVALRRAPGLV
ncbi:MAG: NUDIX domain-containing protein [Propionibacteriaceae bacterium]|nr:NUDIX domain-containing protein [Propionibacteriaceae bacterium]